MKKILYSVLILAVAGVLVLTAGYTYMQSRWSKSMNSSVEPIIVTIEKGSGANAIGALLKKRGLIQTAFDFKLYSRFKGLNARYQSGTYAIPQNASIEDIANLLIEGKTATIKVTIPEGRVSWEIAKILADKLPQIDSARFEKVVYDPNFAESLGVPSRALEGYLFPDTYQFPYGVDEQGVAKIMVQSFQTIFAQLDPMKSEVYKKYGLNGVVTFASVVEEEAGVKEERQKIAGVFYNRLKRGMPLGADPTVRYIFRNLTGPIYKSQLNSNSPFNTRKFKGLMPHAVSNPGKDALYAALYPQANGNLYFVAKDNGSMEHFFSSSLKQHNAYKKVAAANRVKYGIK